MPNNSLSPHDHDAAMPNRPPFTGGGGPASIIRMLDGHISPDEDDTKLGLDASNPHEF